MLASTPYYHVFVWHCPNHPLKEHYIKQLKTAEEEPIKICSCPEATYIPIADYSPDGASIKDYGYEICQLTGLDPEKLAWLEVYFIINEVHDGKKIDLSAPHRAEVVATIVKRLLEIRSRNTSSLSNKEEVKRSD